MAVPVRHFAATHGYRSVIVAALCLVTCACSAPTAPEASALPLLNSGQSNALRLAPALERAYPAGVVTIAEGSTPISAWAPDGPLWAQLAPRLAQPYAALIWWQGETDGQLAIPNYAPRLTDLVQRIRASCAQPNLRVVIVRVVPEPELMPIRASEERFVSQDTAARLVNVDDLPRQPEARYHLSDASYAIVAQRILAALQ